jgi:hypothetical protein
MKVSTVVAEIEFRASQDLHLIWMYASEDEAAYRRTRLLLDTLVDVASTLLDNGLYGTDLFWLDVLAATLNRQHGDLVYRLADGDLLQLYKTSRDFNSFIDKCYDRNLAQFEEDKSNSVDDSHILHLEITEVVPVSCNDTLCNSLNTVNEVFVNITIYEIGILKFYFGKLFKAFLNLHWMYVSKDSVFPGNEAFVIDKVALQSSKPYT